MNTPFYNPRKSYEENFAEGPFGAFTDGEVVENTGEPKYDFLGQKAYSPFGIPAGPLINSNFCRPAFDKGFDICVYKTVRSSFFPCHPFPNILPVKIKGDLTLEKAQSKLMTEKICRAIRKEIGNTPLVFKVGYYKDYEDVKKLAEIAGKYGQAISAINTISAEVVGKNGSQALPGRNRLRSGICGASIKWAGLEMAGKLKKTRREKRNEFKIIGVGGVVNPEDFKEYIDAGADFVMSATGAMWNPYLAREIKETLI